MDCRTGLCSHKFTNPKGQAPKIGKQSYVHDSAVVIGNVSIGRKCFVGPLAAIRADEPDRDGRVRPIRIGSECNVQDGAVLHALGGTGIEVGTGSSVSHGAVVHGPAKCGAGCFVGFRAIVFNSTLGPGVYVGMGAIVINVRLAAGTLVPAGRTIASQEDADRLGPIGAKERRFMKTVARTNVALARGYGRLKSRKR